MKNVSPTEELDDLICGFYFQGVLYIWEGDDLYKYPQKVGRKYYKKRRMIEIYRDKKPHYQLRQKYITKAYAKTITTVFSKKEILCQTK